MKPRSSPWWCLTAAASLLGAPLAAGAFLRADVGDVIGNVELRCLSGGNRPLLGNATVNVFVFFKPGQEHSRTALTQLVEIEKEFAGKSVHWVAVASDRSKAVEIQAEIKETGLSMPVLIDTGDELYGRLGVALCPSIGITDKDHKLVADLPFAKVNYATIIRGHIRHQLKEISAAELESLLNPPVATQGGDAEVARRRLKYAAKLFQAGSHEKALENVENSLEKDPKLADAHALRGQILSALGRRDEALRAFEEALKQDPSNETARNGKKALVDSPAQP
jgi:tetratricopeptide (TPR) repeat protein